MNIKFVYILKKIISLFKIKLNLNIMKLYALQLKFIYNITYKCFFAFYYRVRN